MFSKVFRKEKPRVFLGSLMVASRDSWRKVDEWGAFKSTDLEGGLRDALNSSINLPPVSAIEDPKKSDLALEMVVINHQGGEFDGISIVDYAIPFFWRPRVELKARLYNVESGITTNSVTSSQKIAWGQYFSRVFSLRGFFRLKPLFGVKDMEVLLCLASIEVLEKLLKKL